MKPSNIGRRDFLKLLGIAGLLTPLSKLHRLLAERTGPVGAPARPNIIILVFDTLSARHMSLYDYPRKTTPNMERFAKKSTVYHRNYSASNFTQSSTASLLTGVYPWYHRSLDFFTSLIKVFEGSNIFTGLGPAFQSIAYTHNIHAENILEQFKSGIDALKPIRDLALYNGNKFEDVFKNDRLMGFYAPKRWLETYLEPGNSLFLNPLFSLGQAAGISKINNEYKSSYPLGVGERDGYLFRLEDAIDWIQEIATSTPEPYFGYFHLLPPHEVYKPRAEFLGIFSNDNFNVPEKPEHYFSEGITDQQQKINSQLYDEYIALVDSEFGRLLQYFEDRGVLDNTYFILTSDHGQLLERGIHGHSNPALYESVIHVPLVIHAPGQTEGADVYPPTSLIDLVPTLLHLSNRPALGECEGVVLPGLGGAEDPDRIVFCMHARRNARLEPLTKVTYAAIRWPYKLIHYRGYSGYDDVVELFDLEQDPEEMDNLAVSHPALVADLKEQINQARSAAEEKSLGISARPKQE